MHGGEGLIDLSDFLWPAARLLAVEHSERW
jgi:hypothetical protein